MPIEGLPASSSACRCSRSRDRSSGPEEALLICFEHYPRGRSATSQGPLFLAVTHVPEHPLVPARPAEMLPHASTLDGREARTELVGYGDHLERLGAELLGPVHVYPLLVSRVGRA